VLTRLLARSGVFLATALIGSMLIFALMAVLPGDPAQVALGVNATPETLAAKRHEFGTDRPLVVQYLSWLGSVVTGRFGTSYLSGQPIGPQIFERLQVTAWLIGLGLVAAIVVAVPLGVFAAVRHRHRSGVVLSGVSQLGVAVPGFIAAILLVNVFAVQLHLVPSGGWTPPAVDPAGFLSRIVLPVTSLGLVQGALLSRYVRSATLGVLREDYIRTARAKGMGPARAFLVHGTRNAAIPVVTVLGLQLASLLIETIIIERVFVIPGLGSLLLDSVASRDLLLVQGIVLVLVVVVLLLNALVDTLYVVIDPRLRRS
jgi:peptide/nickel transport system permease protein